MEIVAIERNEKDTNYGTIRLDNYEITMIANALYEYEKNHGERLMNNINQEWKVFQSITSYGRVNPELVFAKWAEENYGKAE